MGISLEMFKKLLSFGLRNHVGNISQLLNGRLDQMLMALFLPPIELGWYATAVSVSTLVQVGSSSFAVFLFPKIAQSENFSQQQELVRNNMRVSLTLLLILGILFSLVIPFAIPIIYTFNYIPSIAPAMILILAGICLGVNENLSAGLQGFGKPEALAKAQILGLVITGLLLWILLPIMGIMGAALASLVAYFITLLYLGMVLSRCAEIPMRKLFSPMPFSAFVSLVSAGLKLAFQKYVPFFETNKNK
jgi:O-antigen/teichoic acid export membrane protein